MTEPSHATSISRASVVRLARGVRLREDPVREQTVLLAPERALSLDPIAIAIIKALDGKRSLGDIASEFARDYEAPEDTILADIVEMVRAFSDRRLLEFV